MMDDRDAVAALLADGPALHTGLRVLERVLVGPLADCDTLDADRERPGFRPYYPGGGEYAGLVYNVAYTKAMLQAALSA